MSKESIGAQNSRVGLGIVGLGNWSYQLGRAILRSDRVTLLSCYTRTAEKRAAYAETFHCVASSTLQEFLATPGLEAVLLSTPAHAHDELAVTCARQGLHVFVEKPMALSLAGAMRLLDVFQQNGSTLMVGHEMRRLGSIRAAKQLLQEGTLGQVVSATARMTLRGRFESDNWRCHRDTNRGGALMQLGIHPIDNLNYLLGRPTHVRGSFANAIAPNKVDDVGCALITYESGVEATVSASYVSPRSQRLTLFGTKANLHMEVDMRVWPDTTMVDERTNLLLESAQNRDLVHIAPRDVLVEQVEDFARSIRTNSTPETGADEGLWAVAVVEGALRSRAIGSVTDVHQMIDEVKAKRNLP